VTVRKVVIHRPGGYDRLTLEIGPDPAPRPGEVLVRAESVGVNYADWAFLGLDFLRPRFTPAIFSSTAQTAAVS